MPTQSGPIRADKGHTFYPFRYVRGVRIPRLPTANLRSVPAPHNGVFELLPDVRGARRPEVNPPQGRDAVRETAQASRRPCWTVGRLQFARK